VDTTTSEISLEVVVASTSTRSNKNKCSLTCLRTLTS
jgi:hypothetical protein